MQVSFFSRCSNKELLWVAKGLWLISIFYIFSILLLFFPELQLNSYSVSSALKDTHREKAPSNETPALTKSMNMDIWVAGTSNQLFVEVLKLKK